MIKYIVGVFIMYLFKSVHCYQKQTTACNGSDWTEYKDEKCLKLIPKFFTQEQGSHACRQEHPDSRLVSIKSADEQRFIAKLIFETLKVHVNVWIGARRDLNSSVSENGTKFFWEDRSEVTHFTDWAEGSPTTNVERDCIIMESALTKPGNSSEDHHNGKWRDMTCEQANYIICEKLQEWTFKELQQTFFNYRRVTNVELENQQRNLNVTNATLISVEKKLNESLNELDNLKQNPVPIGFIYIQLPSQSAPTTLWPNSNQTTIEWQDITSQYAGQFFRAEGNGSEPFGNIVQEENAPRLTKVRRSGLHPCCEWESTKLIPGQWSTGIGVFAGSYAWQEKAAHTHQFHLSGGEVRPRNSAIRIWKRIK